MTRKVVFLLLVFPLWASCAGRPPAEEPGMFEKYDRYMTYLHEEVTQGTMSVSEAESLRHKALKDYLEELKAYQIERESRNW